MQHFITFINYNWNPKALIITGIINTGLFYYKNNIDGHVVHKTPYIWDKQAFPVSDPEIYHQKETGNNYLFQSCICTGYGGVLSFFPVSFNTIKNHLNVKKLKE